MTIRLPGSDLPDQLLALGYSDRTEDGETERILPAAITETVLIEGSTVPQIRHHAGIAKVTCWRFSLP
jgi:hypothetical protein